MFWPLATIALAIFVGCFIASASLQMPKCEPVAQVKMSPLGFRLPIIVASAIAIAMWAMEVVPGPLGMLTALLGWWLLLIAILDAEHFWLPDRLTIPLGLFGLIVAFFHDAVNWRDHAIGALAGFLALAAIAFVYQRLRGREGLGGGDPRLLAAGGAWIGWMGLPSVLVWASGAALTVVVINAVRGKQMALAQRIPLGTYLALGIWLTWLYGPLDSIL